MKDKGIKFETLRKPKLIRNLVILFMITFIGSAIYFKTSSAKYQTTQVIPIINTKVVNKPWWTLTIKETGKEEKTIKSELGVIENTYTFNDYEIPENYRIVSQTCTRREGTLATEAKITIESNKLKITDSAKHRGTACEVYIGLLKDKILADNKLQEGEPDFSKTTCNNEIAIANTSNPGQYRCTDETQNGLYQGTDDYGTTYYYRGSINNNWVKFGKNSEGQDIWWRIIRINGNGSVRLIYAGEGSANEVSQNYEDEKLRGYFMNEDGINDTAYVFNQNINDNAYMGYMYGDVGVTTDETCDEKCAYQKTHANTNDSDAKIQIDAWYEANLQDEGQYLDGDTGFCGDRSIASGTGVGREDTKYGIYKRFNMFYEEIQDNPGYYAQEPLNPIYTCPNKGNDLYTTAGDNYGNKALIKPVGLITADEMVYAGSLYYQNKTSINYNYGYWLWTGQIYWTITPWYFHPTGAAIFEVQITGHLFSSYSFYTHYLRPVVNLKADVNFSDEGNGTIDNPYVILI